MSHEVKTRICRICGVEKPITDFYYRKDIKGYRTECKQCAKDLARLRDTGCKSTDVESAYLKQNGKCAICGCTLDSNTKTTMACDHDHKTGLLRGLLCIQCNVGLGQFKDSTERLQKAIEYLRQHETKL